jgi:hypothetical protein
MATTYTLIDKSILGSTTASVTFTSIPSTYTDLLLKASARSNKAGQVYEIIRLNFNGVTTNQSSRWIEGSGSGTSIGTSTRIDSFTNGDGATSNTFGNTEFYIPNYTGSNYKSITSDGVNETNATFALAGLFAGLWSDTSAITQIEVKPQDGSAWLSGSSFYLYGIKNS